MKNQKLICCRDLPGMAAEPSPFDRLIALGYYDGLTSGIVQCASCRTAYRCDMVGWDGGQDLRVYLLAPVAPEAFDALVSLFKGETPRWPTWVPKWRFESVEDEAHARAVVDGELAKSRRAEYVVAATDLSKVIVAARAIHNVDRRELAPSNHAAGFRFWSIYLGI